MWHRLDMYHKHGQKRKKHVELILRGIGFGDETNPDFHRIFFLSSPGSVKITTVKIKKKVQFYF